MVVVPESVHEHVIKRYVCSNLKPKWWRVPTRCTFCDLLLFTGFTLRDFFDNFNSFLSRSWFANKSTMPPGTWPLTSLISQSVVIILSPPDCAIEFWMVRPTPNRKHNFRSRPLSPLDLHRPELPYIPSIVCSMLTSLCVLLLATK